MTLSLPGIKCLYGVELFNVIEPANDAVRSSIVSGNVEMIRVYVYTAKKKVAI